MTPLNIKELRRRAQEGEDYSDERWKSALFNVVTQGNLERFKQNEPLKNHLLSSGIERHRVVKIFAKILI